MADTNNNGATPAATPGVTPGASGGTVAGATDPIGMADADLSLAATALQGVLEPKLSTQVRKHTAKLKKKLETLVGEWLDKAVANPGLAPGRDPSALRAEWNQCLDLKALVSKLVGLTQGVDDTILVRQAEVWTAVLAIYGIAGHVPNDPQLAELVARTQAALSPGPRKQKVTHAKLGTPIPKGKKALQQLALANAQGTGNAGTPATTVTPSPAAAPAPAGPVPVSEAPASNSNSGTPSSGHLS
jgi:hypothetical protein